MKSTTKQPTNIEIVVLALERCGGSSKKIFSEDIAAEAHRLAPDNFSWQLPKYREYGWPDKYKVKNALEDAKKEENGGMVEGCNANDTSKDGWVLTASGVKWLADNRKALTKRLKITIKKLPEIPKKERQRFLRQVKNDPLFIAYKKSELDEATSYQFTDMLNCSPDAPREIIESKFNRLQRLAQITEDKEVIDFFKACEQKYSALITNEKN